MPSIPSLDSLIHTGYSKFNLVREQYTKIGREKPTVRFQGDEYAHLSSTNKSIRGDLFRHDLDGMNFYRCTFVGVRFNSISDVSFSECKFVDCDFSFHPEILHYSSLIQSVNLVFFECRFEGGKFDRQELKNFKVIDPVFGKPPSFRQCKLSGNFIYQQEVPDNLFLNGLIQADTAHNSDVYIKGKMPKFTWEQIRFASKLPFLQVSFVSATSIAALAVILPSADEPFAALATLCGIAADQVGFGQTNASHICENVASFSITSGVMESLRLVFMNFLIIFVGAYIQTTKCPDEVIEFSRAYWVRQLRRPNDFYTALASRERIWLWPAAVMQGLGVGYFLYRAGDAFVRTFG